MEASLIANVTLNWKYILIYGELDLLIEEKIPQKGTYNLYLKYCSGLGDTVITEVETGQLLDPLGGGKERASNSCDAIAT